MKVFLVTHDDQLRGRLSARLLLVDRPEDSEVIVVFDDAMDSLESAVFYEKPVVFLHRGRVEDAPKRAFRLGVPEDYILDATNLRFSQFRKLLESVVSSPILPDPMIIHDAVEDEFVIPEPSVETYTPASQEPKPNFVPEVSSKVSEILVSKPKEWWSFLEGYPGQILLVTGLRGGVGVSTVAAALYHHLSVQGLPVAVHSPKPQPIYSLYFRDEVERPLIFFGEDVPDELPSTIVLDLPHYMSLPDHIRPAQTLLVVEPSYYDLRLFEHGSDAMHGGVLVVNRTRDDVHSDGALRYMTVIQSYMRPVVVPFRPVELEELLKTGRAPDEGEPFASAIAEIAEMLSVGV